MQVFFTRPPIPESVGFGRVNIHSRQGSNLRRARWWEKCFALNFKSPAPCSPRDVWLSCVNGMPSQKKCSVFDTLVGDDDTQLFVFIPNGPASDLTIEIGV